MRILGIDPGSRVTGYGCVDRVGNQILPVTHGVFRLFRSDEPFEERLLELSRKLKELITELNPGVLVVEKVFFAKNAVSALKLGHVRGVVLLEGATHGLEIVEYNPTEVKRAITGFGRADKNQVLRMVQIITAQKGFATHDASDALALALCHALSLGSRESRIPARSKGQNRSLSQALASRVRAKLRPDKASD